MFPGPLELTDLRQKKDGFHVTLVENRQVTGIVSELTLSRPAGWPFRAGQRISVCHNGICRDYSLASGVDDDVLRLLVRRFEAGALSPRLCDMAAEKELTSAAASYVPCVSRGRAGDNRFADRVTDYLARHLAPGAYDFYLCGDRFLIRDAVHLVDDRFPGSRIFTEAFF